jgi:hypothetical protein
VGSIFGPTMQNMCPEHWQWRTTRIEEHWKFGLHGFLQNNAKLKKVCKNTSETNARQSLLRGV